MANLQYIGARYVPKFFEGTGGSNDWVQGLIYEPLTIVTYLNTMYTSKKTVPANVGSPNLNPEYWVATGNYNAQVEEYKAEVDEMKVIVGQIGVVPESFGAIGDGLTDDTIALQNAINEGARLQLPVILSKDYYITSTINVPDKVSIISLNNHEAAGTIYAQVGIGTAFKCSGVRHLFQNLRIYTKGRVYDDNSVGIDFDGNSTGDVDSFVVDTTIGMFGTSIMINGRNVIIANGDMSHARYGVRVSTNLTGLRGIRIIGTRFHGTGLPTIDIGGVDTQILTTDDHASIFLECNDQASTTDQNDVQIIGCMHDQGGTFLKGRAQMVLVGDCYICHFYKPAFVIQGMTESSAGPASSGSWLISGCTIFGMNGRLQTEESLPFPEYAITSENYGRVAIIGNNMSRQDIPIKLTNTKYTVINGNAFSGVRNSDRYCVETDSGSIFDFVNNSAIMATIDCYLAEAGTVNSACIFKGNSRIYYGGTLGKNLLGSFSANGTAVPAIANHPKFWIRLSDLSSLIEVTRFGDYCGTTIAPIDDGFLFAEVNTTTYAVTIKKRANDGTVTIPVINIMPFIYQNR